MHTCWNEEGNKRPSFKKLVVSLNCMLENVAGYLDFSTLAALNDFSHGYDHLCSK